MNCHEVQQLLTTYWDMPENDELRRAVDEHLEHCAECAEEFEIWSESQELIRQISLDDVDRPAASPISQGVMDRIYSENRWLEPTSGKSYRISLKLRRNVNAVLAFFMALFVVSMISSLLFTHHEETVPIDGLNTPATAMNQSSDAGTDDSLKQVNVLVASISEPPVLKMDAVPKDPNYYLALSLVGLISVLLIMNWLSRIRI